MMIMIGISHGLMSMIISVLETLLCVFVCECAGVWVLWADMMTFPWVQGRYG